MQDASFVDLGFLNFFVLQLPLYNLRDAGCEDVFFSIMTFHIRDVGMHTMGCGMWGRSIAISIFPNPATQVFHIIDSCRIILHP